MDDRDVPPTAHDAWDLEARHETRTQRLDRNFSEMLQELRVAQTGVQILFAFLLTVAFSARAGELHGAVLVVYGVTVLLVALATCFLIGPVACHRLLFGHQVKGRLVAASHRMTLVGLALLGASVVGSLVLVLQASAGWSWALLLAGAVAAVFLLVWVVLPLALRTHDLPGTEEEAVSGTGVGRQGQP